MDKKSSFFTHDNSSTVSLSSDESDEIQTPPLSPTPLESRVHFFEEDEEEGRDCLEFIPKSRNAARHHDDSSKTVHVHPVNEDVGGEDGPIVRAATPPPIGEDKNWEDIYRLAEEDSAIRDIILEPLPDLHTPESGTDTSAISHHANTSAPLNTTLHHGMSRSALLHKKIFWQSRLQARAMREASRDHENIGQSALSARSDNSNPIYSSPVYLPSSVSYSSSLGLESDMKVDGYAQYMNAPTCPRVGDIAALRDPYSVVPDMYFSHMNIWTIQKLLYLFDMLQRCATAPSVGTHVDRNGDGEKGSQSDPEFVYNEESRCEEGAYVTPQSEWDGARPWELSWHVRWGVLAKMLIPEQELSSFSMLPCFLAPSAESEPVFATETTPVPILSSATQSDNTTLLGEGEYSRVTNLTIDSTLIGNPASE